MLARGFGGLLVADSQLRQSGGRSLKAERNKGVPRYCFVMRNMAMQTCKK